MNDLIKRNNLKGSFRSLSLLSLLRSKIKTNKQTNKHMNKTEKRKLINKTFLTWLNENYPEYDVEDIEGDGTFTLTNENYPNESMSYHRSYYDVCTPNWSPAEMIEHETLFNDYIQTVIIPEADRLEQLS